MPMTHAPHCHTTCVCAGTAEVLAAAKAERLDHLVLERAGKLAYYSIRQQARQVTTRARATRTRTRTAHAHCARARATRTRTRIAHAHRARASRTRTAARARARCDPQKMSRSSGGYRPSVHHHRQDGRSQELLSKVCMHAQQCTHLWQPHTCVCGTHTDTSEPMSVAASSGTPRMLMRLCRRP